MTLRPLIVGLGSPHGDDQAGWLVIARLHSRGVPSDMARAAKNPSELWDWCRTDRALIVCDACHSGDALGTVTRWSWPDDSFPSHGTGTHDIRLADVLALAAELGRVPEHIAVWTISGAQFQSASEASEQVAAAAATLGDRLWMELQSA